MLYFLLIIAIGIGATVFLIKKGKIKDSDGDLIPDAVEEKLEDAAEVAKEIKIRAKRVKEEVADVVEEVKDVVEQAKDVAEAAKGTKRRGRKPAAKKPANKGGRAQKKPVTSGSGAAVLKNKK